MRLDVGTVMHRRRPLLALTLALVAWCGARTARAAQVEGHLEPGAIVASGFGEIDKRPTLGGDVTVWWRLHRRLDIGHQTGMAVTSLPYGGFDGEPYIGERGSPPDLRESATFLPRTMFGARLFALSNTSLGAFVGASWLMAGVLGERSVLPYPTAGAAIETKFGPGARYGVRVAVNYVYFWTNGKTFVMPTLAFTWGSPGRERGSGPACDDPPCR
jgi:hypothetical protein